MAVADADATGASSVGRLMLRPVRAVAGPTFERAIDGILASPLPEAVAQSLVEHRVVQRIAAEALEHVKVEDAIRSVLESTGAERVLREILTSAAVDRTLQSPEFERVLGQALGSPQVRKALTQQSTSLAAETAARARGAAMRLDDLIERQLRRWLRRTPRNTIAVSSAGIATRGAAFALDALVVTVVFLAGAGFVGLVTSLVGHLRPAWLAEALGLASWLVLQIAYFVGFWSATGQTPGMRVMHLRLVDGANAVPRVGRSFVRLIGLLLAIMPCFAGFLPALVDERRRALPDLLAGTCVLYDESASAPARSSELDDAATAVSA